LVLLIVIGFAAKSKVILSIAFLSFLPVWFYLPFPLISNPWQEQKKQSKIHYVLRKLVDIFPSKGQNFILDNIPANLDIHITRDEILARIPCQQGWLINRLYLSFKEIQLILSR